jgi:predicted ATPase
LAEEPECAVLDELLVVLRTGESRVQVFRGEAGIGKSVLLEYAVAQASQVTVTRAQGVDPPGTEQPGRELA